MTGATAEQDQLATVRRLWPSSPAALSRRPGTAHDLLVLPSGKRPRLLVPAGVRGAEVMFARHAVRARTRWVQAALAAGQRLGLLGWLPLSRLQVSVGPAAPGVGQEETVEDFVRRHVPTAVSVGVLLGPPRANAKPVLQVFDAAGATIAFGKVGESELARQLVRHEATALRVLNSRDLRHLAVPRLIHHETWAGLEILLMEPLAAAQQHSSSWDLPLEAIVEIAEVDGLDLDVPAATSPYQHELAGRVGALGDPTVAAAMAAAQAHVGAVPLSYGRWHGDWAPWNMGLHHGMVQVWDWERSTNPVPVGFDLVHFTMQKLFLDGVTAPQALAALRRLAPAFTRWYDDAQRVDATIALYLVEMLHRYVGDSPHRRSPALTRRVALLGAMVESMDAATKEPM